MTNDDPPASVAPMPGIASDREIMKQALDSLRESQDRLGKTLEAMRHEKPQPNGHVSRGTIINTVLGALLAASLGFAGVSYWRSTDRLDAIEKTARDAATKVDQIVKDDVGRRAYVDTRIAELDRRVAPVEILARDVARLEKSNENFDTRLTTGREERVADNAKIVDAVNASKTELALLRQELQQTRSLIEGQRPMLRRPSMLWQGAPAILLASLRRMEAPFMATQFDQSAATKGEEIADSIDADRDEIEMMRGWLRRMRDMMTATPEEPETPEIAPPQQTRPIVRDPEPRIEPPRRAAKLRSARKRFRRVARASGFTRALERAFGRPTFRGRYWNSLYRSGGVLK